MTTEIVKGSDVLPGDVLLYAGVRATVLRTGEKAAPDTFGRVFDALWARREDTGAEGHMTFGPDGVFHRITDQGVSHDRTR